MTQTELQEILDSTNKATMGPWVTDIINGKWVVSCGEIGHYHTIAKIESAPNSENNAKFIATCRNNIIKCIEEINKLKKELEFKNANNNN